MIKNIYQQSGWIFKSQYNVSKFTKKILKEKKDFSKDWKYVDDIYLDNQNPHISGGIEGLIRTTRKNPEIDLHYKGIGLLLYNMGKYSYYDSVIIKRIEMNLYRFKNQFSHRLAFGAFHGYLNLNIDSNYFHEFLLDELTQSKHEIFWQEAIELIEACNNNRILPKQTKNEIIETFCVPILKSQFKKHIKYDIKNGISLLDSLAEAQYHDKVLIEENLLTSFTNRRIKNLDHLSHILKQIRRLQEDKYEGDLEIFVKRIKEYLGQRDDFKWLYNVEEERMYSYEEVKSRREDYKQFEDQRVGYYLFYPKGMNEEYLANKDQSQKKAEEYVEQYKKQVEVHDLIYDQYLLFKQEQDKKEEELGEQKEEEESVEEEDEEQEREQKKIEKEEQRKKELAKKKEQQKLQKKIKSQQLKDKSGENEKNKGNENENE